MKWAWVGVPALLVTTGCAELNPARGYQEAARQLRISLDRVEPSLQISFPLEESRIGIRLVLGAENPTSVRFKATSFAGRIYLDDATQIHSVGQVAFSRSIDLTPNGRSQMPVDLGFTYRELNQSWGAINSAIRSRKGTWRLEGSLQLEAFGIPFTLPVRATRITGNQP
ncbi:MAG: hypothetical protein Q8O00_03180 [Holophaga sp.]|nr:hypothetical protein [Holophaga sp.]